jgi:hypothetical protein
MIALVRALDEGPPSEIGWDGESIRLAVAD